MSASAAVSLHHASTLMTTKDVPRGVLGTWKYRGNPMGMGTVLWLIMGIGWERE